jgi:integrase
MGSIYQRGDSPYWWLAYQDADGKRRLKSSESKDKKVAEKLLASVERKVRAERESGLRDEGPITVERFARRWLADREKRGHVSVEKDRTRLRHVLPHLGGLLLADVRFRHIRTVVQDLTGIKKLAARTVRAIYATLQTMFGDAVTEELIASSPCSLRVRRGELPPVMDKDPLWRKGAIFTRDEVVALLSDGRVPEDRRVLYALLFCAGPRIGEAAALRWNRYDAQVQPLARLSIIASYNDRLKREKGVKTDNPRDVPVHPVLAKVLEAWRSEGWARLRGRPPTPDDLLIPSADGAHRTPALTWYYLQHDLEVLGLRRRRTHDMRRTFISLAQEDGARPDILRCISHGPPKSIMGLYTTLTWPALCAEVAKLQLALLDEAPTPETGDCYAAATPQRGAAFDVAKQALTGAVSRVAGRRSSSSSRRTWPSRAPPPCAWSRCPPLLMKERR